MSGPDRDLNRASQYLTLWRAADHSLLVLYRLRGGKSELGEHDKAFFAEIAVFLKEVLAGAETLKTRPAAIQQSTDGEPPAFEHTLEAIASAIGEFSLDGVVQRAEHLRSSAAKLAEGSPPDKLAQDQLVEFLSKFANDTFLETSRHLVGPPQAPTKELF